MTFRRLAAIALIFVGTSMAWTILGSSLLSRTGQFNDQLEREVERLWGGHHRQTAPEAWIRRPGIETETVETKTPDGRVDERRVTKPVVRSVPIALESTRATADLDLAHRQKGLLWYATYAVTFSGTFTFRNPDAEARTLLVKFPLPAQDALFDDFSLTLNGRPARPGADISKEIVVDITAMPGEVVTLETRYRSRGLGTWTYAFAPSGTAQVRDFRLALDTNFQEIDFPAGTVSPSTKTPIADGWRLEWAFTNLLSGQAIGMALPEKLNPGPFAARVTFFAPVGLLFFLSVMVIVGVTAGSSLHPMHYWFIAGAFFAFHLLLAYLVDHVSVHVAFGISAVVSLSLVVSYLRLITGMRHALLHAGAAQLVFLVLFSYAFFFEGVTGVAITTGAILTLFVLMQITAKVSWDAVFSPTGLPGRAPRPQEPHRVAQ